MAPLGFLNPNISNGLCSGQGVCAWVLGTGHPHGHSEPTCPDPGQTSWVRKSFGTPTQGLPKGGGAVPWLASVWTVLGSLGIGGSCRDAACPPTPTRWCWAVQVLEPAPGQPSPPHLHSTPRASGLSQEPPCRGHECLSLLTEASLLSGLTTCSAHMELHRGSM